MNPQERQVIDGIFERLKAVANQPREPEAERYIADLVRQQPYATYALAQSVYVQEQAMLNQQALIEQLQAQVAELQARPAAPASGGFLSGLFGGGQPAAPRTPAEPPAYGQRGQGAAPAAAGPWGQSPQQAPAPSPWGAQPPQQQQPRQGMGFLGTAAAAAAGVAGGMVLGSVLSSALGGGAAKAATPAAPAAAEAGEASGSDQGYDTHDTSGDDGWDTGYDDGGDSYDA